MIPMNLNAIWFCLIGVLFAGYAILDGFDLGVGILHLFARNDEERRTHFNAIGPFWDGNEVWLLTAGGALFAAFPVVYATVFSSFYLAIMGLLVFLILRAVSLEFRGKVDSPRWRAVWDRAFGFGSLVPAFLYGVAVGNILRGIPLDGGGAFTGSFIGLLNPYALLVGVLIMAAFAMQGTAYLCLKARGELLARMERLMPRIWMVFVFVYLAATLATIAASPYLFDGVLAKPLFWIFCALLLASIAAVPAAAVRKRHLGTFLATSATILSMVGVTGVSLFPTLVMSSTDPANSLTIYNAASTAKTLTVMLVIALVGMPIVIAYTAYIYRVFKGRVIITEESL
jgi:cytochrome d ubiquinol oxidase subunit II